MVPLRNVTEIKTIYTNEQGCTRPVQVKIDQGTEAIFKYPRNQQGEIVLFNEFISYCIAKEIKLTVPKFGLACVNQTTHISSNVGKSVNYFMGTGFYSERVPKAMKASPGILRSVTNLDESSKLLLLDFVVKNSDRHSTNILVTATTPSVMYAIDFSHALGDPEWNTTTLSLHDIEDPMIWQENRDCYDMLIHAGAPLSKGDLLSASKNFTTTITEKFLDNIILQIPTEWEISRQPELLKHVKNYILNRVKNINCICETIIRERGV